jgi:hypothetical protein
MVWMFIDRAWKTYNKRFQDTDVIVHQLCYAIFLVWMFTAFAYVGSQSEEAWESLFLSLSFLTIIDTGMYGTSIRLWTDLKLNHLFNLKDEV